MVRGHIQLWQGDLSPWGIDWGHNMPQRWENLADKSCKAPGAGLGPKHESDTFPPLTGLGLLGDTPPSLSAVMETPASRVVGTLQRDTFPEGTETPPTASPKGPLPWSWPIPCLCTSTSNSMGWGMGLGTFLQAKTHQQQRYSTGTSQSGGDSPWAEGWVLDVTCLGLNSRLHHLLAD